MTYMFCRAIDSKRSVMADKDETENRGQWKMLKLPINHFESVMNVFTSMILVSNNKSMHQFEAYWCHATANHNQTTANNMLVWWQLWERAKSAYCHFSQLCFCAVGTLTFHRSLQVLQAAVHQLVTCGIRWTSFVLKNSNNVYIISWLF